MCRKDQTESESKRFDWSNRKWIETIRLRRGFSTMHPNRWVEVKSEEESPRCIQAVDVKSLHDTSNPLMSTSTCWCKESPRYIQSVNVNVNVVSTSHQKSVNILSKHQSKWTRTTVGTEIVLVETEIVLVRWFLLRQEDPALFLWLEWILEQLRIQHQPHKTKLAVQATADSHQGSI